MALSHRLAIIPCLLASGASGVAQEASQSPQCSPYFFVQSADPTTDQLPLKSTLAKVEIAGVIASVKVTQVYANTGTRPLEAVYVFPGSTRAAVHGLTMTIGERTIHAKIQDREKARAGYEQAKQEGRSASLLEQHRPNVFQMNVANILPGDEIKVELSYTELLVPTDGVYAFVYPTVVGPRYTGSQGSVAPSGETWTANPTTEAGKAPLSTFDLQLKVDAGMPIQAMSCGSHKASIVYEGASRAALNLDPGEPHGGNRDFILKYRLMGEQIQSGLLLHRGAKENFFLLMAQPPKRVRPEEMPPREYIFVMDVSGSQMGYPLDISKKLMADLVRGLRPQDSFNVMVFEGCSALWDEKGSRPASAQNIQEAVDFVQRQPGGGGTNLGSALERALNLPSKPGLSRSLVVSTDGFIGVDASLFDLIRANLGSANLFAFGIGTSVNRFLIEGMAHAGQGEPFVITHPGQAAATAQKFRDYVSTPVLSQVRVKADGLDIYDVEPLHLPDVLAERPVICFGKWKGEPKGTLMVTGATGAGPWRQEFHAEATPANGSNAALRHLWARQKLQLLSDYNQFGETAARKEQITRLGLDYELLTAHTSFLAVDSQIRNFGPAPVEVRQALPLPLGVSNSAIARLAPGVTSGSIASSGYGSATVEVSATSSYSACAATTTLQGGVAIQPPTKPLAKKASDAPALKIGAITSDRPDAPLARITTLLEQKLKGLARNGFFGLMPTAFTLELRIDASGAVIFAKIEPVSGEPGARMETQIRTWRMETWTVPGLTTLRVPVQVSR